eukprot:TRINITY_DN1414_c3_g1_i2.p1 TRINITY_DN1414_c3_g1~~TRINITY_DN1414_c3_g1_i2.p1  ORF type:complete len:339 (+),score=90.47 TRINITY_DN1414_c3_g1_i2:1911-2927(+)
MKWTSVDGDGLMLIDEDGFDATNGVNTLLESVGTPSQTIAIAVSIAQILSLSANPVSVVDVYALIASQCGQNIDFSGKRHHLYQTATQRAIDSGLVVHSEECGTLSATHQVLSLWDLFSVKHKIQCFLRHKRRHESRIGWGGRRKNVRWHRMFSSRNDDDDDDDGDGDDDEVARDDRASRLVRNDIVLSSDHWMSNGSSSVETEKRRRQMMGTNSPPRTPMHDTSRMLSSPRRQLQQLRNPYHQTSSSPLRTEVPENLDHNSWARMSCTDISYRKPSYVGHVWMSPSKRKRPKIVWRFSASLIDKSRDGTSRNGYEDEDECVSGDDNEDEDGMGEIGL